MLLNILLSLALAITANVVGAYIAVLVHECGHAIAGRLSGFYVTSFGAGTGKPLFSVRLPGGTIFYIGREHPWQGLTWVASPQLMPARRNTAVLLLGGPLANLLLGGLYALALIQFPAKGWLLAFLVGQAVGNIILGLGNLLPLSVALGKATLRSDGAQTLALFPRRGTIRPLQAPDSYQSLRPLWEAIGDTIQIYANLLTAALTSCDLKDTARARRLLEEAVTYPFPDHILPLYRTYALLVEGVILQEEGDAHEGVRLLKQVEAEFAAQRNEASRLLAIIARDDREALSLVETLVDHPLLERLPAVRTSITAGHLLLALRHGRSDIETLVARYEAAQSWHSYMPTVWHVYSALARYREQQEDMGAAAIAYEKAARAARSIFEALENDPAAQEGFAERAQPLLTRGARCLESLGRMEEAAHLRTLIPPPEGISAWRDTANQKAADREQQKIRKEGSLFQTGLLLLGADILLIVLVSVAYLRFLPEDETTFNILRLMFLTRTISVAICLMTLLALVGRWFLTRKPLSAGNTGRYLLYTVGLCWVMFLMRVMRL